MPDASTPNRRCLCSASGAGSATRARPVWAMGCCCLRSSCKGPCVCCSRAPIRVALRSPCLVLADEKGTAVAGTLPYARPHPADSGVDFRLACLCAVSKRSAKRVSGLPVFYNRVCSSTSILASVLVVRTPMTTVPRSTNLGIDKGRQFAPTSKVILKRNR